MLSEEIRSDVEVLWQYHNMRHTLHPCDTGIGLGSHDLGVAIVATDLFQHGIAIGSVLLMSRPYQQRRAFATCKKLWPEVDVICYSRPLSLDDHVASIGDTGKVVAMLVGDTQRIEVYAERGSAIAQEMPDDVRAAFRRLVAAAYVSRLL